MMCNVNTTDNKYTQTINNYWRNITELSSKIWQDFDFTNRSFLLSTVITNYSFWQIINYLFPGDYVLTSIVHFQL